MCLKHANVLLEHAEDTLIIWILKKKFTFLESNEHTITAFTDLVVFGFKK